jgi:hypothetical protein
MTAAAAVANTMGSGTTPVKARNPSSSAAVTLGRRTPASSAGSPMRIAAATTSWIGAGGVVRILRTLVIAAHSNVVGRAWASPP